MITTSMRPRWEDACFAEGRRILVLHGDGTVQVATCAAELEPVEAARLTRAEIARACRVMGEFDRRRAA